MDENVRKRREGFEEMSLEAQPSLDKRHGRFKGDGKNIALLFFLYTLQGIPLGLGAAVPMLLQSKGISYKQQAEFTFVTWPFSLKLIWAPLVDSIYSTRVGRRKTWLIPTQYLIGGFMLLLSGHVERWLGNNDNDPNIELLTVLFFILNFLAATQDIAVDGWALTMLHKSNVGHASTCNSIGQTLGYLLSYVLFMALESADFCNSYLRSVKADTGVITLAGFLYFWGWVFLITTTLVALFKKEAQNEEAKPEIEHNRDIQTAFNNLWEILNLRSVRVLVLVLLTCRIGFSSTDSVMTLKLVEAGIPKEKLGLMAVPLIPVQVALPLILTKYTTGPRPLDIFIKAIPYRLVFGIVGAFLVYVTPTLVPDSSQGLPVLYVIFLIGCYAIHQVCVFCMFVSVMAFFAKVSDSSVGGTYMTLLNTVSNFGGNWPSVLALFFVDNLTWKQCTGGEVSTDNTCQTTAEKEFCTAQGGKCVTILDGFYVETIICCLIGFAWLSWGKKKINNLQSLDEQAWQLSKRKS